MTPESEDYLTIARRDLKDASAILAIGLATVAARCAYFAAFHAAEAAIFEIAGKVVKTHSGVQSEYARLSRGRHELENAPHTFLAVAYRYKQEGDYGIDAVEHITLETARMAVARAELFVGAIATLLDRRDEPPTHRI